MSIGASFADSWIAIYRTSLTSANLRQCLSRRNYSTRARAASRIPPSLHNVPLRADRIPSFSYHPRPHLFFA